MLLKVHSLRSPHTFEISSSDEWLHRIKKDLSPSNPDVTNVSGNLTLTSTTAGFINASGVIKASATQSCCICGEDVVLPINTEIEATFRPPYEGHTPKEMNLGSDDLDVYFIEDGQINVEVLINDALQCALPYQISCESMGTETCENRHLAGDNKQLRDLSEVDSPFAILKNLK